MKKNILLSVIIANFVFIIIFSLFLSASSQTINVEDYIEDKFPLVFSLHLSSLNDLDPYEKEFIDLLEKLPKEEQEYYAKEIYKNGFSPKLLVIATEGEAITVYIEAFDNALNLVEKKEYKNALPYLEIAIKTDLSPLKAESYYAIGTCYGKLKSYAKAIEAYKQAIRIDPDYTKAHFGLGLAYFLIGDRNSALNEYKILKDLDVNVANKLFDLIY